MIIQSTAGKCETIAVEEARRLWFALTGERRGRAGDKSKARRIRRWFFPPDREPESHKRFKEIKAGAQPTLEERSHSWMDDYDAY